MSWLTKISAKATSDGFLSNIEQDTLKNDDYRRVIYTTKKSQLVLMSLEPGVEIGEEVHDLDQFIRFESGEGKVVLNGTEHKVQDGFAMVVPAGTKHNVINTSKKPLKLYTVYSPPNHLKDTVQHTKADEVEDHFDGETDL